jgi:Zierdtviridae DNA primase
MSTPFQRAARDYLDAGWSALPLPARQKSPVPTGFTGSLGTYVTKEHLDEWLTPGAKVHAGKLAYAPGNIALRLPDGVIGVDVDAYGTKAGERTLALAEEAWGALPPTYVSTSRTDGLSGIRLFRTPKGLAWPGELPQGKGVELLRWDHRFAIVSPSIHDKTGEEYTWYRQEEVVNPRNGDGNPDEADIYLGMVKVAEGIPELADLTLLPKKWLSGLTGGVKWKDRPVDETLDARDLQEWLSARNDPDSPCPALRKTITDYARALRQASDDGGAHDSARNAAWAVLGDAFEGHGGVVKGLAELRAVFLRSVAGRRSDDGSARAEWARIVLRGAQKISAEGEPSPVDPCVSGPMLKPRKTGKRGLYEYPFDELGNASRLVNVMAGRARWVEAWDTWAIWSDTERVWSKDTDRQVERWSVRAINDIEQSQGEEDDPVKLKAIKAHVKASRNISKVRSSAELARGRRGIIVPAEHFDADPRLLPCGNGTLELLVDGVNFRESRQADYSTVKANTPYNPKARSRMWDSFLDRFVPHTEIRTWLQMLMGYSLLGTNPARLFIFIIGESSTGKTTFVEAMKAALGGLAGPMPTSVFRDNADDKPRPDLLGVMNKRLIVAEEVSSAVHLHADQIKRLTGGGEISARGMRSNTYIVRRPAFTPLLATNGAPTISGADVAVWRRLLAVPFDQVIPYGKDDLEFTARLIATSKAAILRWIVDGYRRYVENPNALYAVPRLALTTNSDLRDDMSDLDTWIAERCDRAENLRDIPSDLFNDYTSWCEMGGVAHRDRVSNTKFGRELTAKGFAKKQVRIEGVPTWHRIGIALKSRSLSGAA